MMIDPMMVAILVFAAAYAAALVYVACTQPEVQSSEETIESRLAVQKARHVAGESLKREPDLEQFLDLIDLLPIECRQDRDAMLSDLCDQLKKPRQEFKELEEAHGESVRTGAYVDNTCDAVARQYDGITESFMDGWQQLATFRKSLCDEISSYTKESVAERRARCKASLEGARGELAIYSGVFFTGDVEAHIDAFEQALRRITEQLSWCEYRSYAVRQLIRLEEAMAASRANDSRTYRMRLAETHCGVVAEVEAGIAWFKENTPQSPRLERLKQLGEHLTQGEILRNRILAVRTLRELSGEVRDLILPMQVACGALTRDTLAIAA